MFAIITFRNTGPIKTWADMRAANVHNARTKPLEHALPGTPRPEHLIGSGDLVADVKLKLRAAGINPDHLRKNGVIAYEAIQSASAEFFEQGNESERSDRLSRWKAAQVDWAVKRYGHHRIASMVLHLDEKTPHIHMIVVPLEEKADGRRKDGAVRWSLVGRTISGPGRFDEVQDAYAAAMAPFGLQRGSRGSGRKHEPVPVYLARMAEKEREADELRSALFRDRDDLVAERSAVERIRADAARDQRLVLKATAEIGRRSAALAKQKAETERAAHELARERAAWARDRDAAETDLARRQASFARFRDELIATREKLAPIVTSAAEFARAAAGLRVEDIVPVARPAVDAARRTLDVVRTSQGPAVVDPSPQPLQQAASHMR